VVFNSTIFLFAFLPIVFTLFWAMKGKQERYVLLAVSGYVFYGYWNWRFCGLLLFSSLTSFLVGLAIDRATEQRIKRRWVALAVGVDLALLGFFKYFNFFASSVSAVIPGANLPVLDIVLPIGISFYTFHTMSYVIDVAAGRVRATRNIAEYFTYVSLFSQLVAGPIVRYRQIEDDLEHIDGPPREDWMAKGIAFFIVGLIKKVIIADNIAQIIDPVLADSASMSFGMAWSCALGYTAQLYFDFSGYSDMAVGLGYMFGLRIPQNFNAPYRALGIGDFWRRWHISLSTWLRDYLYLPLGGNRRGPARTYVNLMIVMLLGGLWHGANWTFVVWGAYHGLLLSIDRAAKPWLDRLPPWLYRAQTFLLVVIGWVFFRSENLTMAGEWLAAMVPHGNLGAVPPALAVWLAAAFTWAWFVPETWDLRFPTRRRWALAYAALFFLTFLAMNGTKTVFLYYQF
jgi:alginate O-acetyltransferase complex protein AlgI